MDDGTNLPAAAPKRSSVYSHVRDSADTEALPPALTELVDRRNCRDGLDFLSALPDGLSSLAFFDPQYRGVLDHQDYGNEGHRQSRRAELAQMSEPAIGAFLDEIIRVLTPKGHLMLWVDKFHVAEGISHWFTGLDCKVVDLITWDKGRLGMGYRTRRRCEYLVVVQKLPVRAKGIWTAHNIPDVWQEAAIIGGHPHAKPVGLQGALIGATTAPGSVVLDPAAGGYSVMTAAHSVGRRFLGCDLLP